MLTPKHKKTVCARPWMAMVVTHRGQILSCCTAPPSVRFGTLGQGQSITEILNSPTAQGFRSAMACTGADVCGKCGRGRLSAPNRIIFPPKVDRMMGERLRYGEGPSSAFIENREMAREAIRRRDTQIQHVPLRVSWSPGGDCNLACEFCNQRGKSMPPELSREVAGYLLEHHDRILLVNVTGGEPFVDKRCLEFLRRAKEERPDFTISLTTNGTAIDFDLLHGLNIHFLAVSVNAALPGTYERDHQGASWDTTFGNLERLHKEGYNTSVSFVITNKNILEVPDAVALYEHRGWTLSFSVVNTRHDPKRLAHLDITKHGEISVQQKMKAIETAIEKAGFLRTKTALEGTLALLRESTGEKEATPILDTRETCAVCRSAVYYQAGGRNDKQIVCPNCKSRQRNRSVAAWIEREIDGFQNVLEIGQVLNLSPVYVRKRWAYTILDKRERIGQNDLSYRGDVCDLPYKDGAFSLVVAGNVLEHIEDDAKAYVELLRVLAPGGRLIVQVPINPNREETEEFGECRPDEFNHWRAPGTDYIGRLQGDGLIVETIAHGPKGDLEPNERFFVIRKEGES